MKVIRITHIDGRLIRQAAVKDFDSEHMKDVAKNNAPCVVEYYKCEMLARMTVEVGGIEKGGANE